VPASGDSEDDCGEARETEVLGENLPQRHIYYITKYTPSNLLLFYKVTFKVESVELGHYFLISISVPLL
jgi:hypothetical protein